MNRQSSSEVAASLSSFTLVYYVERPDAFGPEWMIGFNVAPVVENILAGLFSRD